MKNELNLNKAVANGVLDLPMTDSVSHANVPQTLPKAEERKPLASFDAELSRWRNHCHTCEKLVAFAPEAKWARCLPPCRQWHEVVSCTECGDRKYLPYIVENAVSGKPYIFVAKCKTCHPPNQSSSAGPEQAAGYIKPVMSGRKEIPGTAEWYDEVDLRLKHQDEWMKWFLSCKSDSLRMEHRDWIVLVKYEEMVAAYRLKCRKDEEKEREESTERPLFGQRLQQIEMVQADVPDGI